MKHAVRPFLLLLLSLLSTACTSTSPLSEAYYTGGVSSSYPGGYTRTIFSSSNF